MKTNWIPSRKVISGGVAGLTAFAILAGVDYFGVIIPEDLRLALPFIITSLVSYFVPPAQQDILRRMDDKLVAIAGRSDESEVSQTVGELADRTAMAADRLVRR